MIPPTTPYIGRFAPSPTGPLHFGSLLAALASFLDAKAHNGLWLLRIEDIDQPRCVPDADNWIKETLFTHGLQWDGDIMYQSQRLARYHSVINDLHQQGHLYACRCTRKQIRAEGGVYKGQCRALMLPLEGNAIRLKNSQPVAEFVDAILGSVTVCDPHALEDTLLKRRDGIYSYNLAVVVDDIDQRVNHIVRGSDLLSTTAAHLTLYELLQQNVPTYAHIPVAASQQGRKLSKQNHARALDSSSAVDNLARAVQFLGLPTPQSDSVSDILDEAAANWHYGIVPKLQEVIVAETESTYHSDRHY